ncbi:thiol reductant ABC exporter subunit CydD [Planococcus citreus]|uniref:ATP-binding cassette subfamily C protein CydD n=2 Tax=Planococcus citreus TaxID=1373 RepID=A0A497YFQ5_9BACL|nr:thiol reductant ABC exporter subunit CydD [Planococcus citreus]RLJ86402.1 ATP-binding cassette subfamily C protein CydD [Planococcus citreus]
MGSLKQMAYSQNNRIRLLFLASLAKGLAMIGQALFFVWVADSVFLKSASFEDVLPLLAALLAVILLRAGASYAIGRLGITLSVEARRRLRRELIASYKENPLQGSIAGQSGRKVGLLLEAVDDTDGYFSKYIPQMIQSYTIPLMLLGVIFYLNWTTGLIILITAPFIPLFMAIVGKRTKQKADEKVEQLAGFSGAFLDVLQGLTTLRLFGQAKRQSDTIRDNSLKFRDSTMDVLKSAFLSSLTLEYISMLSIGIVALEIGLRLVVFDSITFFPAFLVMLLVPDFFNLLKEFGSAFHTARGSAASAELLTEELAKNHQPVEWGEFPVNAPIELAVEQVGFQYGEGFQLEPASFKLDAGTSTALVGASGSGKSTLMNVMAGLLPATSGRLLINGLPQKQVSEDEWFGQLSYITQDPYLFAGTIKENIELGSNQAVAKQELIAAAQKAGILELVESLPEGFDTVIGEAGRGLSGGEKQRLVLARAFLKKPSLLFFDEPTAGLDLHTEQVLQRAIEELSKEATVITIAHRLHTIRNASRIIVLDAGKVEAIGTHEELMDSFSPYRSMIEAQQGGKQAWVN